jgi:hypothetical protein
MRPLHDEHNSPKACNDADSCPTLRTGVRGIYLSTPLDAQAGSKVQTGLSSCLQPHLVGPLYRHAMEVLAYTDRHARQAGYPLDIIANNFLRLPAVNSKIVQSTGDLHHKIVILFFRIAENIFDNATSFDPRNDMFNYNPDT